MTLQKLGGIKQLMPTQGKGGPIIEKFRGRAGVFFGYRGRKLKFA
jgi:hypothetical protein